jgi:hypothetical protein
MKRLSLSSLILFLVLVPLTGQSSKPITLEWDDPNPVDAQVLEYVLYHSTEGSNPTSDSFSEFARIAVGSLEHQTGLTIDSGKHWFYVTASNWAGESDPSNVLMINTNRPGPVLFRIRR